MKYFTISRTVEGVISGEPKKKVWVKCYCARNIEAIERILPRGDPKVKLILTEEEARKIVEEIQHNL